VLKLKDLGFERARPLEGGLLAWRELGYPTEKRPVSAPIEEARAAIAEG
jgi:hypothetical protein